MLCFQFGAVLYYINRNTQLRTGLQKRLVLQRRELYLQLLQKTCRPSDLAALWEIASSPHRAYSTLTVLISCIPSDNLVQRSVRSFLEIQQFMWKMPLFMIFNWSRNLNLVFTCTGQVPYLLNVQNQSLGVNRNNVDLHFGPPNVCLV